MYFLISNLMVPCYCFGPSPLILPSLEVDISSSLQQSSKLSPGLSSTLCAKQPALTNILSHRPPTILAVPLSCSSQLPLPIGILNVHLSALLEPKLPHVDQVKRKIIYKVSQTVPEMTMCSPTLYSTVVLVDLCGWTMPCNPIYHCHSDTRLTNSWDQHLY